ncbi:hypothetical protein [Paenarthrobacter sp. AMU7]|uniref:Uncharacterized protein n=1 Tax=Paenarthrobacter sp. AMU7 TaxID=3162492 RepID=A0AB39YRQ4_9MICC
MTIAPDSTDGKKLTGWKRHWKALGGLSFLAVVIATITLLQAFTDFTLDDLLPKNPPTVASASQGPSQQASDGTSPSPAGTGTPSTTPSRPTSPPSTPPAAIPADILSSIVVKSELGLTTYWKVIGQKENLYQMVGGFGQIQVAYGWSGRRADGTEIRSNDCQIAVTISGPQSIPTELYGQCTNLETRWARASENLLRITTPGTYEVKVEDKDSGAVGSSSFTVLAE